MERTKPEEAGGAIPAYSVVGTMRIASAVGQGGPDGGKIEVIGFFFYAVRLAMYEDRKNTKTKEYDSTERLTQAHHTRRTVVSRSRPRSPSTFSL